MSDHNHFPEIIRVELHHTISVDAQLLAVLQQPQLSMADRDSLNQVSVATRALLKQALAISTQPPQEK